MPPLAVVILAAGKGTRMKSDLAKVLHPICGKPMIYFPMRLALDCRPQRTVPILGHQAAAVEAAIRNQWPRAAITVALQKEQHGTAHAVLQAKPALRGFDGNVLILSGDVPLLAAETISRFRRVHAAARADLTVMTTSMADPTGYGRCLIDAEGNLRAVVEQKDATPEQRRITEINAGIYLVRAELLWWALARIGRDNAQGEMYLTDLIGLANRRGARVRTFSVADTPQVLGVNSRAELAAAARHIRAARNDALMREGVTLVDPATVYVDVDARVGRDTVIEPGVMLLGRTRVGCGCHLGAGCRLDNAVIADGERVAPHQVRGEDFSR